MKLWQIYICSILFCLPIIAQPQDSKDIWVAHAKKGAVQGYIDLSGREIAPVTFDEVGSFKEGFAWVKKANKYGLYDKFGKLIIPVSYAYVGDMSCGMVPVKNASGKWGYFNSKGTKVIDFIYSGANKFQCGLASVQTGDSRTTLINRAGQVVYKCNDKNSNLCAHFEFWEMREGRVMFSVVQPRRTSGLLYGFLDKKGEVAVFPRFRVSALYNDGTAHPKEFQFYNGRAKVAYDTSYYIPEAQSLIETVSYGFIDSAGNEVIDHKYYVAGHFNPQGVAYAIPRGREHAQWIDRNGNIVFEEGDDFKVKLGGTVGEIMLYNGLIPISSKGLNGVINLKGDTIIPFNDWRINLAKPSGFVITRQVGKTYTYAIYNSTGMAAQDFVPYSNEEFSSTAPLPSEGFMAYRDTLTNNMGYKNYSNQTVIPARFEYAFPFQHGVAPVREKGRPKYKMSPLELYDISGFIDQSGRNLFGEYSHVYEFINIDENPPTDLLNNFKVTEEVIRTLGSN